MNYDPYFEAEVCVKCGRMERKKNKEIQKVMIQQSQNVEIARQILGVMAAR
jgi:Zn ribbon nucleic-acid-binding protein